MTTLEVNLEKLNENEVEQLLALVRKSNRKSFEPDEGSKFYAITPRGETFAAYYHNSENDQEYLEMGNCFKSEHSAQTAIKRQKLFIAIKHYIEENDPEILDWNNIHQRKFTMALCNNEITVIPCKHRQGRWFYFSENFNVKELINKFGITNLIDLIKEE